MEFLRKNNLQFNNDKISSTAIKYHLNEDVVKLLFARGIDNEESIDKYLSSGATQLNNPFLLKNMDKVTEKIKYYLNNKKKILIMGDYDTDGISASAILYKYFESVGTKVDVFLPNRFVDGYGLTIDTLDKVKAMYNPELIITVDCGITCVDEIEYCKKLGIDIIVTDHHDIPEIVPNTLIINPKLPNQIYPFKELCGAGVALKIVQALGGIEEAIKYTTIASLATVADIVPLMDENRAIVKLGLANQKEQLPKGIKALCKQLKIPLPLTSTDISFKIAPKINATGRMGDAIISFRLYVENDENQIKKDIADLLELNDRRVSETNNIFLSACEMLEDTNVSRLGMIVLYNEQWESGVLGIICSKLVEKYNKPVCLLSLVDNEFKGSCRSIPGVNIFEALNSVSDILIRFGGHNQAGGLSIKRENLKDFRTRINDYVLNHINEEELISKKYYDMDISNINVTPEFVKDLEIFEPCGFKNEKPTFKINLSENSASRMMNFPQHIRLKQNNLNLIGFGKGDYFYNLNVNCNKEAIIELALEKNSKTKINGFIRHINYSKLNTATKSEIISANYLMQLKYINFKSEYNNFQNISFKDAINKINECCRKSRFGTAVIINDMDTYFNCVKTLTEIKNYELFNLLNACGENVIIFSPNSDVSLKDYQNIFVMDSYLCKGYITSLCTKFNNVYTVNDNKINMKLFSSLDTNRNTFAKILNAIKSNVSSAPVPDIITYFNNLRRFNLIDKGIKFNEFIFFILTMEELGILSFSDGVIEISGNKSNLEKSCIYNFVTEFLNINRS